MFVGTHTGKIPMRRTHLGKHTSLIDDKCLLPWILWRRLWCFVKGHYDTGLRWRRTDSVVAGAGWKDQQEPAPPPAADVPNWQRDGVGTGCWPLNQHLCQTLRSNRVTVPWTMKDLKPSLPSCLLYYPAMYFLEKGWWLWFMRTN